MRQALPESPGAAWPSGALPEGLVDDRRHGRLVRLPFEVQQRVRIQQVLLRSTRAPDVDGRVEGAGSIGLEGDRERVRTAGVEEVGERFDPLVPDPLARIEADDPGQVRPLVPEFGAACQLPEEERHEIRRPDQRAVNHGVEVRPVDVRASDWECTLEADAGAAPAVRLGLLMIKGLAQASAERIVQARAHGGFASVEELMQRARLDRYELKCLAAGDALSGIAGHRRRAYWNVAGVETTVHLLSASPVREGEAQLRAPSEGDGLVADYASLGLTLGRHPLALLRSRLARMRLAAAAEVRRLPHGASVRAAGIVIGRQRPETASGVVFVTLEDETGCVNVIVWRDLGERQRRELLSAQLLAVYGSVEREGEVVHVIARRLADHSELLGKLATRSRDFH